MMAPQRLALACVLAAIVLVFIPLEPFELIKRANACLQAERGMGHHNLSGVIPCLMDSAVNSRTIFGIILGIMAPAAPAFPWPGSADEMLEEIPSNWQPKISLRWFAPFFSSGGYSSEALSFVSYLKDKLPLGIVQHGDSVNEAYLRGLPVEVHSLLRDATRRRLPHGTAVEVCHSEPGKLKIMAEKQRT